MLVIKKPGSGSGSVVTFKLDPDLYFDTDPKHWFWARKGMYVSRLSVRFRSRSRLKIIVNFI